MNANIEKQFKVASSSSNRNYVVSLLYSGEWQCGCMGWTRHFPRKDCRHIREIQQKINGAVNALAFAHR